MNNLNKLLEAASFAAKRHTEQKRKGSDGEPYINHPLEVANLLANIGNVNDIDILIAALLHDTIEDTGVTKEELATRFGQKVADYVAEVSDDKSLPNDERKRRQVEHAPHLSQGAKQIKLADKISNINDVTNNPPNDWPHERRVAYVDWGENVAAGLRGANAGLEKRFDETVQKAREKFEQD
ncbi:MAG TPA: HD domain-containing protein [Pyrinomonadaceae bacterium]|jgi:guanosine-3',5'-bis(diphosphate) 3'-pyrophosphohydrolase|nr:HD domain-containing protein [Pyrinomonadaceae bacterium]